MSSGISQSLPKTIMQSESSQVFQSLRNSTQVLHRRPTCSECYAILSRFPHVIQCLSKSSQRFHGLLKITRPRGIITLTKSPEVSQRAPRYLKGHRGISKGAKVSHATRDDTRHATTRDTRRHATRDTRSAQQWTSNN